MSRPGTRSAFFWPANAVTSIWATSAEEIHRPVAVSKMASVYSIGVQASSLMAVITVSVPNSALSPRTRVYPNPTPCLAWPWISMMVSPT